MLKPVLKTTADPKRCALYIYDEKDEVLFTFWVTFGEGVRATSATHIFSYESTSGRYELRDRASNLLDSQDLPWPNVIAEPPKPKKIVTIVVYHGKYGCDTGCCGHWIEATYEDGTHAKEFSWEHPSIVKSSQDLLEFAKRLIVAEYGEEHAELLDWKNSLIRFESAEC